MKSGTIHSSSVALLALASCGAHAATQEGHEALLEWTALPEFPDPIGVAGPFAGAHDGALIVAGGANFPAPAWEHDKVWRAHVRVLARASPRASGAAEDLAWRDAAPLPHPLAYGAAVSTPRGVLCAGGSDGATTFADAFFLTWDSKLGTVARVDLPPLPRALAHSAAALLGDVVYVLGGQTGSELATATRDVFALDLAAEAPEWRSGAPFPGPERAFAVAVVQRDGYGERLYLMSGRRADDTGAVELLADVWELDPARATPWRRRADLPRCVMAGTAAPLGPSHIVVLGGADGSLMARAAELRDEHPGFPKDALLYHTITDTWTSAGATPVNQVTTWAVPFDGGIVVPTGEVRPRARTRAVWKVSAVPREHAFGAFNITVVLLYLLAMLGIGAWFSRSNRGSDDFFRGGQTIPWWAAGLSIFATTLSSITFMAIPAKAYATDWVYSLGAVSILAIAPIVILWFLPFYRRIDATSVYEYLELRFGISMRLFGSASFLLFQIGRMAIVLLLPAIALATITPIGVDACILVMGLFSIVYSTMGGIRAVIWTDVTQAVVLLGGALFCLVLIAIEMPEGAGLIDVGRAHDKFRVVNWTLDSTTTALWVVLFGNILSNLVTYTSDQAVVQRYMTTPTRKQAERAIWVNGFLALGATALFYSLGAALFAFYRSNPERLDPTFSTDAILPLFVSRELPVGIAGLVVAGIFAAAQSTVSTSMNSTATVLVTDGYRRFVDGRSERHYLRVARACTVALGLVGTAGALVLAHVGASSLLDEFMKLLGLTTGALGGLFVLGIFTRRAHTAGAGVGAAAGIATLWFVQSRTDLHFFLYSGVGVGVTVAVGYIASLVLPGPAQAPEGLCLAGLDRSRVS
ncbi:MAG: sodium:solute symporter [Planctomycetota bacterium]|nr:MAG: sodium:solute symporter [Planctomycetota bacterium]